MNKINNFLLYLFILAVGPVHASCDFEDFPVHPSMKLVPIISDATHNGQSMLVKGFYSDIDETLLKRFYSRRWKDELIVSSLMPWEQLSVMDGGCLSTVQYKSTFDGVEGRLAMTDVRAGGGTGEVGRGLVMPDDAVVATDTIMDDGPKIGRVSMIASKKSPSAVSRFYQRAMLDKGWSLEQSFTEGDARVLIFRDGPSISNVLMIPAPGMTQIFINTEQPQ
jgi:hypothetical protein